VTPAAAGTTPDIRTTPIVGAPFGALLELDLASDLSGDEVRTLRFLLATHDVLVVRGGVSEAEQRRLCGALGRVLPQGPRAEVNDRPPLPQPEVIHISNVVADAVAGDAELDFHYEFAYLATPPVGLSLYAEEFSGGPAGTRFVSGRLAYRRLPPALQRRLDRLQGLFVAQYDPDIRRSLGRHRDRLVDPTYPRAVHPLVIPHPATDEPILYVTASQVDRVLGLSDKDSDELLQTLFAAVYVDENVYEHRYEPGDLVLWDNLNVQHARPTGTPGARRTLRRMVFGEKTPWEEWPFGVDAG
jgi:taurine dioxygenase